MFPGLFDLDGKWLSPPEVKYNDAEAEKEYKARVQRLFKCVHPIFGRVKDFPAPEEAFEMGKKLGEKLS